MAITPLTGFKAFTFDGETSTDYGVQILGEGVFNAPEREVEMINIPGRNGAFALDKGRFENIDVKYPANIIADSTEDFAEAVSDLRNFLCSRKGYCRLTDDYHPDEYRMAVYREGLEVDERVLRAGDFDIVFDCMPQRYLTSGEEAITVADGETITNPTLFEARPMLEVEGYGEIDVNGEAITLQNITFGKIPVIEAVAVNKTDTGVTLTMPVKIDTSNLNQYDWFRLEDITATVRFTNKAGYVTDNCSTATGILTTATTNTTGTLKTVKAYGQSFHYGTPQGADALQPSAGFIDRWTYEGVTSYHVSEINMEITYDGNDMVTVELAVEVSECFDDTTEKVLSVTNSIGNSTKSALGHPTYIDLDIGEAWNSDSGTAVSLNNVVQIPAKLPTLKAGANEITFDNTVTELKVVPRWWRV